MWLHGNPSWILWDLVPQLCMPAAHAVHWATNSFHCQLSEDWPRAPELRRSGNFTLSPRQPIANDWLVWDHKHLATWIQVVRFWSVISHGIRLRLGPEISPLLGFFLSLPCHSPVDFFWQQFLYKSLPPESLAQVLLLAEPHLKTSCEYHLRHHSDQASPHLSPTLRSPTFHTQRSWCAKLQNNLTPEHLCSH